MTPREYPYAVMRRLDPVDVSTSPYSCHHTAAAAVAAARRASLEEARSHGHPDAYIAVEWSSPRWAREFWPACREVVAR